VELLNCPSPTVARCTFVDLFQSAVLASDTVGLVVEDCRLERCAWFPTPLSWSFPATALGAISLVSFSNGATVRRTVVQDCGGYVGKNAFRGSLTPKYDGLSGLGIEGSSGVLVEDCSFHRNWFGGIHVSGASAALTIRRCNFVHNGAANDAGKDTALFTGGQTIVATENYWGLPQGPVHDGAGSGNGIDGGGSVAILPVAARPFVAPGEGLRPYATVATGDRPRSIALGDFDGDGLQDIAVAEDLDGTVSVALRALPGGFLPRVTTTAGGSPVALAPGRFDGDPFLDLAVLDESGDRLVLLFGDGTGAFTPSRTKVFATLRRPLRLRVADLDAGGGDDVVVACAADVFRAGGLQWFRNDGAGNLTSAVLPGTSRACDVEVIDLNGDARPELVACDLDSAGPGLRHYANLGGGAFGPAVATPIDTAPFVDATLLRLPVVAGADDLALATWSLLPFPGVTRIRLFRGTNTGTLLPPDLLAEELGPVYLRSGDFDLDGLQHLVVVNPGAARVTRLGPVIKATTPFFPYALTSFLGQYPAEAAVGDVTGDGAPDLLVADGSAGRIAVLRGEYPTLVAPYGTGCPGVRGVPRILTQSLPKLGSATFALAFEDGASFSAGVLLLGLLPADVPLPGGCRLAVDEFLAILVAPSDGTGFGSTPLPIPDDLALPGASFYAQWFVLDAQGALLNQASSTRGIRVRLGG
jgi:hypothetical protein